MNISKPERLDDLQLAGLKLIQNPAFFCFGMDAVLLSGYARAGRGDRVLDLCSGNGIIPILLSAKTQAKHLTGLELFEENVDLARRSIAYNHLEERVSCVQGDVKDCRALFEAASFEAVTCNPPYISENPPGRDRDGRPENRLVTAARHETDCTLDDVARAASYVLKSSGRLFMVHRPHRLPEIIRTLSAHHLEPKRMRLVYPFVDKAPNMVLLEAVKGGRARMTVDPPLIVYEKPGIYTKEILSIYGLDAGERA